MKIQKIEIKNFRSIVKADIPLDNYNIFIGLNDAGKSNVLKALNLFFHGETEIGVPFNFSNDFSRWAIVGSNKAKEIRIKLTFDMPAHYIDSGIVIWEKVWRNDNIVPFSDTRRKINGQPLSSKSRANTVLNRINYVYIPAVKSNDYFDTLLEMLYSSISELRGAAVRTVADQFAQELVLHTKGISERVLDTLKINSSIAIPENQSMLFRTLMFNTKIKDVSIPLDYRGDGIKAGHIPAILMFIADELEKTKDKYAIACSTIWGYEEPENGIELRRCYKMANEFLIYTQTIQLLLTTHSPAFYYTERPEGAKAFYVQKIEETQETDIKPMDDVNFTNEEMGLMPLVEPYIREHLATIKKYRELCDTGLNNVDTIFVEGESDKLYIERACELLCTPLHVKLKAGILKITTKEGRGGCNSLKDWILAWCYSKFTCKAIGIFDNDDEGKQCVSDIKKVDVYKNRNKKYPLEVRTIPLNERGKQLMQLMEYGFSIEDLFPLSVWDANIEHTKQRDDNNYIRFRDKGVPCNKTYIEYLTEKFPDEGERKWINIDVPKDKKRAFCNNVIKQSIVSPEIFNGFQDLISILDRFFSCPTI
jgi:hypothetical protein